eukprot:gene10988-1995_t
MRALWCGAVLLAPRGASSCASDMDCHLNGVCKPAAPGVPPSCECDLAWGGDRCDTLRLGPARHPAYRNSTTGSWGASVVRDDAGGFGMAVAEMANGCGLASWRSNSRVAIATAPGPSPLGPFSHRKVVLPCYAHNPALRRAPDGTYLLFFMGRGKDGVPAPHECRMVGGYQRIHAFINHGPDLEERWCSSEGECMGHCDSLPNCKGFTFNHSLPGLAYFKGYTVVNRAQDNPSLRGWVTFRKSPAFGTNELPSGTMAQVAGEHWDWAAFNTIQLATAKSLGGPWKVRPALHPRKGEWDDSLENPAPWVLPNGTVVLVYRGGNYRSLGNRQPTFYAAIGVAAAPRWDQPFRRLTDQPVLDLALDAQRISVGTDPEGSIWACVHGPGFVSQEDPFLWQDTRGAYHLLMHTMHAPFDYPLPDACGGHAFSTDLLTWNVSQRPAYNSTVHWTDLTSTRFARRERPQMLLRDGYPVALYNGAQEPGQLGDAAYTFSIAQPIYPYTSDSNWDPLLWPQPHQTGSGAKRTAGPGSEVPLDLGAYSRTLMVCLVCLVNVCIVGLVC